jgi:hypothetical protein
VRDAPGLGAGAFPAAGVLLAGRGLGEVLGLGDAEADGDADGEGEAEAEADGEDCGVAPDVGRSVRSASPAVRAAVRPPGSSPGRVPK